MTFLRFKTVDFKLLIFFRVINKFSKNYKPHLVGNFLAI